MFTPPYHRHKLSFAKGSPDHDDQPHLCVCVCTLCRGLILHGQETKHKIRFDCFPFGRQGNPHVTGQLKFTWKRFEMRCGRKIRILKILSITFSLSTLVYLGKIKFWNKHLGSWRLELSWHSCACPDSLVMQRWSDDSGLSGQQHAMVAHNRVTTVTPLESTVCFLHATLSLLLLSLLSCSMLPADSLSYLRSFQEFPVSA